MAEQGMVLTGRVLGFKPVKPDSPHYKVQIHDGYTTYWAILFAADDPNGSDADKIESPIVKKLKKDEIQSFRVRVKASIYEPEGGKPRPQLDVSIEDLLDPVGAGK